MTGLMPVTVAVAASSTEAWGIVARLEDAGIKATVIELARVNAGFGGAAPQVPVQVEPADVDAARRVLESEIARDTEPSDDPSSDDTPREPHRMPLVARAGWVAAACIILLMLALFVMQLAM